MARDEEQRLRRELAKLERGPGKRYPRKLREQAAAWARGEMATGRGFHGLARRLALHPMTLKAWMEDLGARVGDLVPVEIVGPSATTNGALALVSPSGYRLEGLTLDDAIHALARLR